jgi:outer membrane protein assembly factor BamD
MRIFQGKLRIIPIFLLLIVTASCSKYQRLLKSTDNELKLEKAIEYYERGDYNRAIGLLTDVIPAFRGTQKAETINYYFAMAHFKQRDYLLASHYFKSFAASFPNSEHAEEFLYLSAYCKYLESPRSTLDQTTSREAIQELQAFINRFPNSERVEDAHELIDELRFKLEEKVFQNAVLYYNLRDYTAAITTFNTMIRDYPDTQFREEALFYIIRANFDFAEMSIPQRQIERYGRVVTAYNNLLRQFPETRFMSQATRMKETAQSEIERLQATLEITENN